MKPESKSRQNVTIVVIVIVLLVAGVFLYTAATKSSAKSSSSTASSSGVTTTASGASTSLSLEQQQVQAQIAVIVYDMTDLNGQNLTGLYTSNAVLTWMGPGINATQTGPINYAGTYTGTTNIASLWSNLMAYLEPSMPLAPGAETTSALPSNIVTTAVSPTTVNATWTLFISDDTSEYGRVQATINIHETWSSQTGTSGGQSSWFITQDTWDFVSSAIQYPL